MLSALIDRGLYHHHEDAASSQDAAQRRPEPPRPPPKRNAYEALLAIRQELGRVLSEAQAGKTQGFHGRMAQIAARLQTACKERPDDMLAVSMLDKSGRYSTRHMLHTAVLVETLAVSAGLSDTVAMAAVSAALTMNLSMADIQDRLNQANRREQLSPQEKAVIASHPQKTMETLLSYGVDDQDWLDAVLGHHERLDGSGYPKGATGSSIPIQAQLVSMCDGYTARLENRQDRAAKSANESMRETFLSGGAGFDPMLSALLVKRVGIYPPGTAVLLESGEKGVVVARGTGANHPRVMVTAGKSGNRPDTFLFRDTSDGAFTVRAVLSPDDTTLRTVPLSLWINKPA